MLTQQIEQIRQDCLKLIESSATITELESNIKPFLGKGGKLSVILEELKNLSPEEKTIIGKLANETKKQLELNYVAAESKLTTQQLQLKLSTEYLDLSAMPLNTLGSGHPLLTELDSILEIFSSMGFEVREPYLVDNDFNTFTALNIPQGHPARDMWDTIRVTEDQVLITHTSSMQHRILKNTEPPIRVVVPGKCFRNEATDATHEHSFMQIEGVYLDKNIKISDLLGTLFLFLETYFNKPIKTKIQPTFFPFVEPGMEIMIDMNDLLGLGTEEKWLEVIPCGMIHPNVLNQAGVDASIYSGFAWGAGVDRLVLLKNQIKDIRLFHSGKIDFINKFK